MSGGQRQAVPTNQRVYAVIRQGSGGMMTLDLSLIEPVVDAASAVLIWRGTLPAMSVSLPMVSDPAKAVAPPVRTLGTFTLAQTAGVAVAAGMRQLTLPLAGLVEGDNILLFPTAALPAGFAIYGAVVPSAGRLQVTFGAPALAIGASFSIVCRVVRLG